MRTPAHPAQINDMNPINEKTINEFVKEMKEVFGKVEFKATNNITGQIVTSKHWLEIPAQKEFDCQPSPAYFLSKPKK